MTNHKRLIFPSVLRERAPTVRLHRRLFCRPRFGRFQGNVLVACQHSEVVSNNEGKINFVFFPVSDEVVGVLLFGRRPDSSGRCGRRNMGGGRPRGAYQERARSKEPRYVLFCAVIILVGLLLTAIFILSGHSRKCHGSFAAFHNKYFSGGRQPKRTMKSGACGYRTVLLPAITTVSFIMQNNNYNVYF